MGRPKTWNEIMNDEKLTLVEGWKRDGLSDEQVAKNLGVCYATVKDWKKRHPSFLAAIKKGKEVSDYELENTLHKRAMGYEYEEKVMVINAKKETTVVTKTIKQMPPDTGAIIFALKNRLPGKYREKWDIEHSGKLGVTIIDDIK